MILFKYLGYLLFYPIIPLISICSILYNTISLPFTYKKTFNSYYLYLDKANKLYDLMIDIENEVKNNEICKNIRENENKQFLDNFYGNDIFKKFYNVKMHKDYDIYSILDLNNVLELGKFKESIDDINNIQYLKNKIFNNYKFNLKADLYVLLLPYTFFHQHDLIFNINYNNDPYFIRFLRHMCVNENLKFLLELYEKKYTEPLENNLKITKVKYKNNLVNNYSHINNIDRELNNLIDDYNKEYNKKYDMIVKNNIIDVESDTITKYINLNKNNFKLLKNDIIYQNNMTFNEVLGRRLYSIVYFIGNIFK